MEYTLESPIEIFFSNEQGEEKSIDTTLGELIDNGVEYFQEQLEECQCTFNESQNHCDCTPEYEDYKFKCIVAYKF